MKILVITGPGLGDCLLSVPFINALRQKYPTDIIDSFSLVERAAPGLSEGHKILERLCFINNYFELEESKPMLHKMMLMYKIYANNYDLVVDLWPNTKKKSMFSERMGKRTAGFDKSYDYYCDPQNRHKCIIENELLKELGIDVPIEYPSANLKRGKPKNQITISVSRTDDPLRSWGVLRWANILQKAHDKYKCKIIFVGADVNKGRIDSIIRNMTYKPEVQLNEIHNVPKVVNESKLHLTENGGLMHIAAMTKTPILSLSQSEPGWGPYGKHNTEIIKPTMKDITEAEVWEELKQKMK